MTKEKEDNFNQMIAKLQQDPDKFERMFAVQYLVKYSYLKSKEVLYIALNDEDPEAAEVFEKL